MVSVIYLHCWEPHSTKIYINKYKLSKQSDVNCKDLNLEDLKKASKECFYKSIDVRLQNFIDYITERTRVSLENENFKYNVIENLFKARNLKCNSTVGNKRTHGSLFSLRKVKAHQPGV